MNLIHEALLFMIGNVKNQLKIIIIFFFNYQTSTSENIVSFPTRL